MSTLYELTKDYQDLLAMAEDPDVDQDVFADTLEGLEGEIEDKAEAYAIVMKELKAEADKFDAEGKRLLDHADHLNARIDRMKAALMNSMSTIGKEKISTEHFKVSIVKNGGLLPLKFTGDVPDEYKMLKPEIDVKRIRETLMTGAKLEFAYLGERGQHLSIR